jgi:hypothetical protein
MGALAGMFAKFRCKECGVASSFRQPGGQGQWEPVGKRNGIAITMCRRCETFHELFVFSSRVVPKAVGESLLRARQAALSKPNVTR